MANKKNKTNLHFSVFWQCLLSTVLVLWLTGCGGGGNDTSSDKSSGSDNDNTANTSSGTNDSDNTTSDSKSLLGFPDDPLLDQQWYLLNIGQSVGGTVSGTPRADVRAADAWRITMGAPDVVVAVLDTGIAFDHPDLSPNIWTNPGEAGDGKETNGIDDDGNGYVDDWRGWDFVDDDNLPLDIRTKSALDNAPEIFHGTAVASVIAAAADNGYGMAGLAPDTRIMPLRVLDRSSSFTDADVAAAIRYARDMGAKIVNMSFVSYVFPSPLIQQAIKDSPEVLFIAAAGNVGNDNNIALPEPCTQALHNIICVAATDENDGLAQFSGGSSSFGDATVDLAAPGDNMLVAQPPAVAVAEEGFERTVLDPWVAGGTDANWSVSTAQSFAGNASLAYELAGDTADAGNSHVRMTTPIDLQGQTGCWLSLRALSGIDTGFLLRLETSSDGTSFFASPNVALVSDTAGKWKSFHLSLADFEGGQLYLGFRYTKGFAGGSPGTVYIDAINVTCNGSTFGDDSFAYAEGTSFSTPLVAGAAALALAEHPDLTPVELKAALLFGGDYLFHSPRRTLSGKRLNAYQTLALLAQGSGNAQSGAADAVTTGISTISHGASRLTHGPAGELIPGLELPAQTQGSTAELYELIPPCEPSPGSPVNSCVSQPAYVQVPQSFASGEQYTYRELEVEYYGVPTMAVSVNGVVTADEPPPVEAVFQYSQHDVLYTRIHNVLDEIRARNTERGVEVELWIECTPGDCQVQAQEKGAGIVTPPSSGAPLTLVTNDGGTATNYLQGTKKIRAFVDGTMDRSEVNLSGCRETEPCIITFDR